MEKREDVFQRQEGTVFPGKTYAEQLLQHVFQYQRDFLYEEMLQVHRVHIIMLAEKNLVSRGEAQAMLRALEELALLDAAAFVYEPQHEDLFFLVEQRLQEKIGADTAGNMHIGRSRNDMGVTMYRLALRRRMQALLKDVLTLQETVLQKAAEHKETIMPAYTHTQPAQPTTLGHYLLAVGDALQRDGRRLQAAYDCINCSPLGAAALAGTSFSICRERTAQLLGFARLVEHTYDAIAGADYLLETSAAILICMTNLGRFLQDLLQQATKEFGGLLVAAPYVQISSIMPQKRNPVSLEHARSLASSACAEAQAVFQMVHNTPFGDIVDTEDDLQPHLYRSMELSQRVLRLLNAVLRTMSLDREKLQERARQHCITITELVDVLTRHHHVPFRRAHRLASGIAQLCIKNEKELYELSVAEVNEQLQPVILTAEEWSGIVSPAVFIARRATRGGPNVQEVERMIAEREQLLRQQQAVLDERIAAVQRAAELQKERVQELMDAK